MTAPFGVNILAQTVRDRTALLNWLTAATPACVVCMDDDNLTQQIRKALPNSIVIHRAYNPNDAHMWDAATPAEWVAAHLPFARNYVMVQCLNEPVLNDAAFTWLEQVVGLCPPAMCLALPNFAVGNPHEDDILRGKYDRLLRLVCGTRHVLALHEYFVNDPAAERPFLCGRYTYWQRRARVLGLPAPRICITEHGRDIGGGPTDGWQGAGWSEQDYYRRLVEAQEAVYDSKMPVALFCWGTGAANRWRSFDIQDAPSLQKMLVNWNAKHPISEVTPVPPTPVPPPTPVGAPVPMRVTATAGLKLRAAPNVNATVLRLMPFGEAVTAYPDTGTQGDGYRWIVVTDALGNTGWAADVYLQKVVQPPVPTPTFKLFTPFKQYVITSRFNDPRDYSFAPDKKQQHEGIDGIDGLAQKYGSDPTVHVGKAGTVVKVGFDARGYGNYCIVDFGDNWRAWYAHFESIYVREGQKVAAREIIGLMGGTGGTSTAPHAHITLQHIPEGLDGYVVADVVDPEPHLVTW